MMLTLEIWTLFLSASHVPGSSCSVSSLPVVVRLVQQWTQHMRQFPEASDDPDFHVKVHG